MGNILRKEVYMKKYNRHAVLKKAAFTLAEVLITLGIIGVVAALTVPTLIQNYQKKTWVEGLKVGVSTLEQGFKKAMADDGVTDMSETSLVEACHDVSGTNDENTYKCYDLMKKYFKFIKIEPVSDMQALGDIDNIITDTAKCKELVGKTNKWWYLNDKTKCRGWKNNAYTLANGMRFDIALNKSKKYNVGNITALDINGSKGPNTWGRDTFYLAILHDGRVVPLRGYTYLKIYADGQNTDYDEVLSTHHWSKNDMCSKTTNEDGHDCAARVIDNGYKMDY